jgi:hypothetical protein
MYTYIYHQKTTDLNLSDNVLRAINGIIRHLKATSGQD